MIVAMLVAVFACGSLHAQQAGEKTLNSGLMKMKLKKGLELKGSPVDLEEINVNTLFGAVDIPIHTIAGIRFAQDANEQSTIVLLNGDAITGDITMSGFDFVSSWGKASVNVGNLVSIVFRDDLAWSGVNTPNGRRWRLTRVQSGSTAKSVQQQFRRQ
jgi:hypothetical protein